MAGHQVAIAGVGYSQVGRHTGLRSQDLTIQCVDAALEDAGIQPSEVDGFTTMGGQSLSDAWLLGISPLRWWCDAAAAPGFVYAAHQAIAAIQSGFCHTAVATRVVLQQPTGKRLVEGGGKDHPMTRLMSAATGDQQFVLPFGGGSPVNWAGLLTQRHMAEFGTTELHFGQHAISQRSHAALNDDAFFRDPLTLQEYLESRYVSKPVRLLDCDYPCDSGAAVVFTTLERARDARKKPVLVEASALTAIRDLHFEILDNMAETAPKACADDLWSRTELKPCDLDTAQLYDGFAIITLQWLEALGICGRGEAGPFIGEGNTRLGGQIPVNTDGGACNVGRRHGANFCIEAVRQLRGECGARQVPDARASVFTNSVGPFCGAVLLATE